MSCPKFEQLCRLCAGERGNKLGIFEPVGESKQLSHKIRTCLPIKVYSNDLLPKKVCTVCVQMLDTFYEFSVTSLNVDTMLKNCLPNFGAENANAKEVAPNKSNGGNKQDGNTVGLDGCRDMTGVDRIQILEVTGNSNETWDNGNAERQPDAVVPAPTSVIVEDDVTIVESGGEVGARAVPDSSSHCNEEDIQVVEVVTKPQTSRKRRSTQSNASPDTSTIDQNLQNVNIRLTSIIEKVLDSPVNSRRKSTEFPSCNRQSASGIGTSDADGKSKKQRRGPKENSHGNNSSGYVLETVNEHFEKSIAQLMQKQSAKSPQDGNNSSGYVFEAVNEHFEKSIAQLMQKQSAKSPQDGNNSSGYVFEAVNEHFEKSIAQLMQNQSAKSPQDICTADSSNVDNVRSQIVPPQVTGSNPVLSLRVRQDIQVESATKTTTQSGNQPDVKGASLESGEESRNTSNGSVQSPQTSPSFPRIRLVPQDKLMNPSTKSTGDFTSMPGSSTAESATSQSPSSLAALQDFSQRFHYLPAQPHVTDLSASQTVQIRQSFSNVPWTGIQCQECYRQLPCLFSYVNHLGRMHPNRNGYKCIVCGNTFAQYDDLVFHTYQHPWKECGCSECHYFKYIALVGNSQTCLVCHRKFSSISLYIDHAKKCWTTVNDTGCNLCGMKFQETVEAIVHKQQVHAGKGICTCLDCGVLFNDGVSLQGHVVLYHGMNARSPTTSSYRVPTPNNPPSYATNSPLVCTICKKVFSHEYQLRIHAKMHSQ